MLMRSSLFTLPWCHKGLLRLIVSTYEDGPPKQVLRKVRPTSELNGKLLQAN
jgi:hypothetical protein